MGVTHDEARAGGPAVSTGETRVDGIRITVRTPPNYELPHGVRDALERLSEAIVHEAENPEVTGFELPDMGGFSLTPKPGEFGPVGPMQEICLGGFECSGYEAEGETMYCKWIFWD